MLLNHGGLYKTFDREVHMLEEDIVDEIVWLEKCNLNLVLEWINHKKIESVVPNIIVGLPACGKVDKVGAAFYP